MHISPREAYIVEFCVNLCVFIPNKSSYLVHISKDQALNFGVTGNQQTTGNPIFIYVEVTIEVFFLPGKNGHYRKLEINQ